MVKITLSLGIYCQIQSDQSSISKQQGIMIGCIDSLAVVLSRMRLYRPKSCVPSWNDPMQCSSINLCAAFENMLLSTNTSSGDSHDWFGVSVMRHMVSVMSRTNGYLFDNKPFVWFICDKWKCSCIHIFWTADYFLNINATVCMELNSWL